jgi:hypothetical protein
MFLKRFSSNNEHAKTDFLKLHKLPVQACGTGSVHTVSWICTKGKMSVLQKRFPVFKSPRKKHDMQK